MNVSSLYAALVRLAEQGRSFVLATVIETHGSCPQKPGAKLAVLENGELLGTIGGGAIEKQIVDASLELLRSDEVAPSRLLETHLTHDLGMCCGGTMKVFLERHRPGVRLWLFGAGHVHREVAALAAKVGLRVTVVDEREQWLTESRFPDAECVQEDPEVAAKQLQTNGTELVCVATHDHALDERVLRALSSKPLRYLGLIGSKRKALRFTERLRQQGVPEASVERIQSPMGMPIGAQTPEEIAVSVVAELIRVCRSGTETRTGAGED
jgi:xanthine dehydrogenase accessory factor